MNDEKLLNLKLKTEFTNPVYDIVEDAIDYTIKKQKFQKYDLIKLVMMIYKKDYSCISNTNDYRDQVKLLDEYFEKEYGHSIITFIMIKTILNYKGTDKYDEITSDIAILETALRTKKNVKTENLCIFSYPIENEEYLDLMMSIEANQNFKYAMAITYDKLKNTQNWQILINDI